MTTHQLFLALVTVLTVASLCVLQADAQEQQLLETDALDSSDDRAKTMSLLAFDADFDMASVIGRDSGVSLQADANQLLVEVTPADAEHPGIALHAPDGTWDLTEWRTIQVEIENVGNDYLHLGLRADTPTSEASGTGWSHRLYQFVAPGKTRSISLDLYNTDWKIDPPFNPRGLRDKPGLQLLDLAEIARLRVFSVDPTQAQSFVVRNVRAQGAMRNMPLSEFLPFIDRYGQFIHGEWHGKVTDDADLRAQLDAEEQDLSAHPGPASFNRYGGWEDGPSLEATGHFRVTKHQGKWWLVDPDGKLFWSSGPDCIDVRFGGYTGVDHREDYFAWLPPREGNRFSEHYIENPGWAPRGFYSDKLPYMMYDFYNTNLQRKFGDDWRDAFAERAHRRLRSWGMNTVASWGDPLIYRQQKTAYTTHVWIHGARPIEGSTGYWGQFPDVFDPGFRETARTAIAQYEQEQTDPWNIGYYVDNEMSWGDTTQLAVAALTSPADQAAKIALIDDLKSNHRDIAALNAAWGTDFESWDALLQSQAPPPDLDRARSDLEPFYQKLCEIYFRIVKEELKAVAPDKLYLGARFAWRNDVAVRASAKYCDVVSYNAYQGEVSNLKLPEGIDRPLIIGEFTFSASDVRGFDGPFVSANNQAHRGERYIEYIRSGLENPQIVGAHWFQYIDQSPAGRPDGENWNTGIISVTDKPHYDLIAGIRAISYRKYEVRAGVESSQAE